MVKEIYPHNDLLNASFHILEKIEAAVKEGIEDGITLDCIGCIAVLAATSEALLNAVGQLKIEEWQERQSPRVKLITICKSASIEYCEDVYPFNILEELRCIRNQIMHCQPVITENPLSVADDSNPLDADWLGKATPEFCRSAFDSIKALQHSVFDALEIKQGQLQSFAIWDSKPT